MAIHYSKITGIPYCGSGVTDDTKTRSRRWNAVDGTRGEKVATSAETAQTRGQVDCGACITQMDADGIP